MNISETENYIQFIYETVAKNPVHAQAPNGAWRTQDWIYREILERPNQNTVTLETGAGISTLLFAKSQSKRHICVVPSHDEVNDIQKAAHITDISTEKINFTVENSALFLPNLNEIIDMALIDGCHGPLLPFLDFYYIAKNLRSGGIIIIDDIQLLAPKILFEFIKREPAVEVLIQDQRAAMVKIHDNAFINYDWGYSCIDYSAGFDIITDELLARCKKLNPV